MIYITNNRNHIISNMRTVSEPELFRNNIK